MVETKAFSPERLSGARLIGAPTKAFRQEMGLFMRAYWPQEQITSGQWTPPSVQVSK